MSEAFRLGRQISLALIFAVCVQTAGVLVWVGAASHRLDALESDTRVYNDDSVRLARLEEQVGQLRVQLDRIEAELRQRYPENQP